MMASSEERMKVLKMVQEGKITPEMAAELLKALDSSSRKPQTEESTTGVFPGKGGGRRHLGLTPSSPGRMTPHCGK